jgi:hypothetical protein
MRAVERRVFEVERRPLPQHGDDERDSGMKSSASREGRRQAQTASTAKVRSEAVVESGYCSFQFAHTSHTDRTPPMAPPLTASLTTSLTHALAHSLTYSLTHSLTRSIGCTLTVCWARCCSRRASLT